jgi:hypothetical protein
MTTFGDYLSQIKPIPGFDSKKWIRKRHAEIQRETEGMTDEQIRERHRQAAERADQRRAEREKTESADN